MLKKYQRKAGTSVTAIQLNIETEGLQYQKWGGAQVGKKGDWLLNNGGDVYTVDAESFARTYRQAGPGQYVKVATVYAELAQEAGSIPTKEGRSEYKAGDYLVFNNADRTDGYRVEPDEFARLYEAVDEAAA